MMSKQVPFEQGDMDWLKRIISTERGHHYDNLLSHGRTERIVNHIEELETQSQEGWDKYKELRKEVANNRYPELTAMVNAESVMESQSVLITKLQQDVAEADDAMCEAQWRFERAEATINKLREVAPKLVEVAEGGIRQ